MGRIKITVFFSVFVAMLGVMLLAPITPSLIRELGLKEIHSGILISTGSIMTAVMAPVWGNISDAKGRKPVILIGFIGLSISTLLLTITFYCGLHKWISGGLLLFLMIVTRSLVGMFIPAILSASQAFMGDVTEDKERGSAMAIISAANGLGLIFGPAIAGIFSLVGLLWPLYFGIVITAVALFFTLFLMPATKPIIQRGEMKVSPLQPGLRIYLFVALVTMIGLFTIQVIGGFYLQDQLGLPSDQLAVTVSFGLMFTGLAVLIAQIIQSKWLKWEPRPMVLIGSLILVASMVTFLLTKQLPFYYLAFFVFGLGSGFMMTGFMTGASLSVSNEQQGGVAGLVTAMQGVSAIIAPILSTSLYHANKHIPMGLIVLLATLLSLFMLRVSQKKFSKNEIREMHNIP
ncbi:MFS transporter [Shouchella clausii]|uniref:MFS transporter n=1 Tax=Shouchella clausii TaxID=79880 RepID=UPI00079B2D25|nr:MFS transporter [Shouchella clausii]PAD40762.1 MFS transporter [Bacillus sp. 7520-S]KKI86785.1 MFS transporter [Shouchella clausii]MBU8598771.1 MFS transporter [Shouchella clausii]MCY1106807.1 MFS transporter [Shouchella clausii]MEB5480693.1 MFS transporter [Shouchella clausii]